MALFIITDYEDVLKGNLCLVDAPGTAALLVCLAMGAMYQQAPIRQKSAGARVSNKAEKDALLPK